MAINLASLSAKPVTVPTAEVSLERPSKLEPAQRQELNDARETAFQGGIMAGVLAFPAIGYLAAASAAGSGIALGFGLAWSAVVVASGVGAAMGISRLVKMDAIADKARRWAIGGLAAMSGLTAGLTATGGLYAMVAHGIHQPAGMLIAAGAAVATAALTYGASYRLSSDL